MMLFGLRTLRLPMKPPTKLRRDSPEMAGLKPEVGLDSPSIRGGVTLTDRPRNPASSFWAASANGFLSMASEAERFRKREISSWILPALNTAPGMEAISFWYFAV